MKKWKYWGGSPPLNALSHLHLSPIGLSQRPMKLNVGVSAGQCRPESIYLHTSTGLVEERLWASLILVSLKSLLHQTWVNGLLMDMQRQVLFLLAEALDKKPKATPWLKAVVLTKHCRVCGSIKWQMSIKYSSFQSRKLAVMQFKRSISLVRRWVTRKQPLQLSIILPYTSCNMPLFLLKPRLKWLTGSGIKSTNSLIAHHNLHSQSHSYATQ